MPEVNDDLDAISGYAGSYGSEMITSVLNGLDIAKDIKVIRNLTAPLHLPKIKANPGTRPLDTSIEDPKNPQRKVTKRTLTPRTGMKIFAVVPEEYRDTFISEQLGENAADLPPTFAGYVWQEEFAKLASELNDNAYASEYNGDAPAFDAADTYSAGDFVKYNKVIYEVLSSTNAGETPDSHPNKFADADGISIVDGFGKIIVDAIADSSIPSSNVVSTGSITSSNAWTKVNDMLTAIGSANNALRNLGGTVHVSQDVFDKYIASEKAAFSSTAVPESADGLKYVWNSAKKWVIKPASWMGTSQRIIWNARTQNLVMGTNQVENVNRLGKVIPTLHGYKAIAKFILSYQIADTEVLFINNQA